MGNTGKVLEAALREAGRSQAEVRHVASGAGAIQSRATGTQEGFRRGRTLGEAAGGPRTGAELCARCRATPMANGNAQEVPVAARPGQSKVGKVQLRLSQKRTRLVSIWGGHFHLSHSTVCTALAAAEIVDFPLKGTEFGKSREI